MFLADWNHMICMRSVIKLNQILVFLFVHLQKRLGTVVQSEQSKF